MMPDACPTHCPEHCQTQCGGAMRMQCAADARTDGRTNGRILNLRNAISRSVGGAGVDKKLILQNDALATPGVRHP